MAAEAIRERLERLLDRYGVDRAATAPLKTLLDALERDPAAPTAVRDPERGVDVHIADSLSGLEVAELRAAARIADLGAGAGLPGLVLAAARPSAHVALVESAKRKCVFLARTAERMGLAGPGPGAPPEVAAAGSRGAVSTGGSGGGPQASDAGTRVEIVPLRAEEWRDGLERCDAVTARALASLPVLCEYAAPLLTPGGVLVCWKGRVDDAEAADGSAAAAVLGLSEPEVRAVKPYPEARDHALWIFRKTAPTPAGFPRRAGIAVKRAISATNARHDTR